MTKSFFSTLLESFLRAKNRSLPKRTETASNLIAIGAAMVTSAFVLHLRGTAYSQGPALIVLRAGLESIGKGGWVAYGTADEAARIAGPRRVRAKDCLAVVDEKLGKGEAVKVYEWLCNFTHLDYSTVLRGPPEPQDVYSASAFVAWLGAMMFEVVLGQSGLAKLPVLPSPAPWNVPAGVLVSAPRPA